MSGQVGPTTERRTGGPAATRRQAAGWVVGALGVGTMGVRTGVALPSVAPQMPSFAPRGWSELAESDHIDVGISVRFMGTSTLLIEDGDAAFLVDGFFSRPSLTRFLLAELSPNPARIGDAVRRGQVRNLDLVLTAHSHHDHAMDGAVVAAPDAALWAGSSSVSMIAEGASFPLERFRTLSHGAVLEVGEPMRFRVTAFATPHSPRSVNPGPIKTPLRPPARADRYRAGENFAFLVEHAEATVLVQPSANYVCGGFQERRADLVFLGIGGVGRRSQDFFDAYWRETVQRLGARVVVLIHWDDFFVSLDAPLRPMRRLIDDVWTALERVETAAARDGVEVVVPAAFQPTSISRLLARAGSPASPTPSPIVCDRTGRQ